MPYPFNRTGQIVKNRETRPVTKVGVVRPPGQVTDQRRP